jgi:hypothetical protein
VKRVGRRCQMLIPIMVIKHPSRSSTLDAGATFAIPR